MQFPGFIGPSYTLDNISVDNQRCVNLFPQVNELGRGKNSEVASLIRTPGLEALYDFSNGPCRCLYTASNKRNFGVFADKLYEITSPTAPVLLGTLQTSAGTVEMADNGIQLLAVDGKKGYVYTFTGGFQTISDPDFPIATHAAFIDQYVIVNDANTRRFYLSALSDATDWDGLDFASKEGSPDNVEAIAADHRELYLFGDHTSEVWFDSGDASFPFARLAGAYMEFGIAAKHSRKKIDNAQYMLAQDKNGQGIVLRVGGYQGQRVSNYAVEKAINSVSDVSGATAWTYQKDGKSFYVLNVPGLTSTWALDISTGYWHERDSWTAQGFTRHRAEHHAVIGGMHVVGDYQNGKLYKLTKPVMAVGSGYDPQVILRVSRNGGRTYGPEHRRSFGKVGEYKPRVMWNKLGQARDFVFEVSGSEPTSDAGSPVRWMRRMPHLSKEMHRLFCSEFRLDMELGTGSVALISAFLEVTAGAH